MPFSTIDKPSSYFNTVLYTGNGTTNTSITGVGFQPDFTWIKSRNSASYNHFIFDAVRGATKYIKSDATSAENTLAESLKSFNSNGFTVGTEADVNNNTTTYASWNWLGANTTVSNTSGTITSTVSANTTSGFSIVSYTGDGNTNATVGHGLGVAPKMIITKNRSNATATNWTVYHASLSTNNQITLNQTDAANLPSPLMVTTVGASTYTLGSSRREINESSNTYIAYCFAEVKGFSKFGSYIGNGSTDGTFIYTGFSPSFIMYKTSSSADNWSILDLARADVPNANIVDQELNPNLSASESNGSGFGVPLKVDFVSNGIKIRGAQGDMNASGATYIYACFASNPFVTSKGLPVTAR